MTCADYLAAHASDRLPDFDAIMEHERTCPAHCQAAVERDLGIAAGHLGDGGLELIEEFIATRKQKSPGGPGLAGSQQESIRLTGAGGRHPRAPR